MMRARRVVIKARRLSGELNTQNESLHAQERRRPAVVDPRRLNKMKLEELEADRALYDDEIALRKAGVAPSYRKLHNSIRIGPRD